VLPFLIDDERLGAPWGVTLTAGGFGLRHAYRDKSS
jgi:hypothetical protein